MLGNNTKQEFLKNCDLMTDLGLTTPIESKKKKLNRVSPLNGVRYFNKTTKK